MPRWILIADASRARIFRDDRPTKPFTLVDSLEHPESRARVRDLMSDAMGRKPAGMSRGGPDTLAAAGSSSARPGAAPDTDAKAVEAQKFARIVAEHLEKGLDQRAYDSLVVVAPPHFLGVLKQCLHHEVGKHVELYINKDLTQHERTNIEQHVRSELGSHEARMAH
jgi:protein required for attachment to host cells